ncbi:extracellular solute-binding protein [Streptosporangium sp. NBC_01639]|uniref:ABC transporter substrate-binding protein n=1 Tax=Streptosporangium sp. NBC_01639 TaxID=2975948 RepID=UPI0038658963|nr:extracellular solute-binding protein [Streptosporangium sp. NBC_01639]
MIKRGAIAAGAVLAGTVLLSACGLSGTDDGGQPEAGGKVTGKVTLQTWNLKSQFSDYIEGVITAFEKTYPGTDVTWLDQPGDGYEEKLLAQASAGELPDVTNTTPVFSYQLAKEGLLADLDSVDDSLKATYVPGSLAAFQFNGQKGTYGYPWYLTTELNYWNTGVMAAGGLDAKRPPTTLEELVTQARTLKEKSDGKSFLMSSKPYVGTLTAAGIPVINEAGTEFVFNSDEAVALLDTYREAYKEGLLPKDVLTDNFLGNTQLFTKGSVGWTTAGGNFIGTVLESNPSLKGKITSSPYIGTPPLSVQGVSIPKSSKNLPTAKALAQFLTNAANQEAFAKLVPGIFPSTTASQANAAFGEGDGTPEGDARVIAFKALTQATVPEPVQLTGAMSTFVNQQIAAAMTGGVTSKEALDSAVAKCNQLLAQ